MNQSSVTNAISVTPALSNGYSTNWSDSKTLIIYAMPTDLVAL